MNPLLFIAIPAVGYALWNATRLGVSGSRLIVALAGVSFKKIDFSGVTLKLNFRISNPSTNDLTLEWLFGQVNLDGMPFGVVSKETIPEGFKIPGGKNQTIPLDLTVGVLELGTGILALVRSGKLPKSASFTGTGRANSVTFPIETTKTIG